MKKNKTCAAYVCAFLLLAIASATFILSRKPASGSHFSSDEVIEETLVEVPEKAEKTIQSAGLEPAGTTEEEPEPPQEPKVETKPEEPAKTEEKKPEKPDAELPEKPQKTGFSDITVQQQLVEEIYETAAVKVQNGNIVISYEQPEIPPDYHLTVKAEVYDENGKTYCRYVSDAGWLNEPSNYDASAKKVLAKMGVGDLKGKMYNLVVKVGDGALLVGATVWQFTQNYDGTTELVKTYID